MAVFPRDDARLDLGRARFDVLVRGHHRALHAYVRVVHPSAHADAVVNASFAQLWQHLADVPDGAVRTWLRAAARHEVLNSERRERRWYAASARAARLGTADLAAPADHRSVPDHPVLAEALRMLSTGDRELVVMTALEDLSSDELAQILGIRADAARRRLARARSRLRAAVEQLDLLRGDR
jgi:RNA polymerase sigma-70 factor (ECF subfamily)